MLERARDGVRHESYPRRRPNRIGANAWGSSSSWTPRCFRIACNTRLPTWFAEWGSTDFGWCACRTHLTRLDLSMACACVLLRSASPPCQHQKRCRGKTTGWLDSTVGVLIVLPDGAL